MPSPPSLSFVPLADVAHLLPADAWIAKRLRDDPEELADETAAWITGDMQWPELHLDTPLVADGGLHHLAQTQPDAAPLPRRAPYLVLIEGNLRIDGALTASDTDGTTNLVVLGSLQVQHAVIGGQLVYVQGALTVDELLWGHYNHGDLQVNGGLTARVALFTDEYHVQVAGGEQVEFLLDEARGGPSLAEFSAEVAGLVFAPEFFDGIDDGADGIGALLSRDRVVEAVRAGESPLRASAEITADMPLASDLFADEAISVANILAAVNSPIVTHKEKKAPGWFGQTDFSLCRRHVDADGDQRDDNVFITVWKTWDFYLSVEREPQRKGLLARLAAAALRRPIPFTEVATLIYRGYTEGTPDGWKVLDDEAPAEAREAATRAWRGVLDYVRLAVGQSRAGYPLYHRLQAELTPRRIEQFTSLPYFTEEYNDWWDSDKNGEWHGEVWVGARQPCLHEGEPYGRALKLSWENGEPRPGDDSDDAYGAYQLDIDEARAGPPVVEFKYTQRQSEARTTLPRGAVDHIARLLRIYAQVEAQIQGAHEQQQAHQAEQRRIETAVHLLATPPLADDLPDSAVFPVELMLLSGQWQSGGETYVAAIRAHQFAMTARAQEEDGSTDEEDEDQPEADLPDDPRKASAPTVLQLARLVNRHADEALAARFRQRFAFAPDAYVRTAAKAGQFIGPVFLLADGRVLARIGPSYSESAHWVQIDGAVPTSLPALKGLGRSADGSCFAQSDGTHITTHRGFGGPQIAQLPLPRGNEGIPESMGLVAGSLGQRCDEIIPFNDGQRVLLRNPTGVYLVSTAHGVQRLHPQEFDEGDGDEDDGGPYTWPKNHQDAADGEPQGSLLAMDMLHMALSPDERFIAVGDQDSAHILLGAQDGRPLRTLDTQSSYPHHARFSHDGTRLWFNSCHLYNGITIATPVDAAGDTEGTVVDAQWRVYASATLPGMVVMGDASGHVHAMDDEGRTLWRHHVGSSISAIEASGDGSTLLVGSYGGYLAVLQRTETGLDPYSISTSPYTEVRRWIFWDNEPTPLRW
ncbi:WD40 repeat domain-containing protein [Acidovorax sp.]|uniref:WD40 repeat domain-containing protein n=1 Tax=Acidovorax sp. TaxID=1872122 RepID=UPI003D045664